MKCLANGASFLRLVILQQKVNDSDFKMPGKSGFIILVLLRRTMEERHRTQHKH